MNVKADYMAMAAVVLPSADGLPPAPRSVQLAVQSLCEDCRSASVAELAAVASYLADLAAHSSLPDEVRTLLLAVRASLLDRRLRSHACQAGQRRDRASGTVTATMQVQVR